jgi:RNA polymerase subunit RPABC4/transcription elongation factor Spt4
MKKSKNKKVLELDPMRVKIAEGIIANPKEFKVCDGCDSILLRDVPICPLCSHYRFNTDIEEIIKQTNVLLHSEPKCMMDSSLTERKIWSDKK